MVSHICRDCQTKFTAISLEEALDELGVKTEKDLEDLGVTYAKYCPYCAGTHIEVR